VARSVFKADFYAALERQVHAILRKGLSETPAAGYFSRNLPGYDAYALGLHPVSGEPTELFFTPEWREMLAVIWGVSPTPYIFVGAHHHTPGSASGFIHNDYNPVWFPRVVDERVQIPNQQLCSYRTGVGPLAPDRKAEMVRGVALILYVANQEWRPGDGGETALYGASDAKPNDPVAVWAPENNSLVSFECTPNSFHTFLSNRRIARTSIIMWVHRPLEEAVSLYGEHNLERWKS
jgi:hypothetical protein